MGKLILCAGQMAMKPYTIPLTNQKVYSIEELCYYIYHNIYGVYEDTFNEDMIQWIEEELKLTNLSDKLRQLKDNQNTLKDIVITVLCACDYYTEEEMKDLLTVIHEIEGLEPIKRQKIKGDHYLKYGHYQLSGLEYDKILDSEHIKILSEEEIGNIYHNQAIIQLHQSSISEAALTYKKAYHYNNDEESLKAYLYALKMSGSQAEYNEEIMNYNVNLDLVLEMNREWEDALIDCESSSEYKQLESILAWKNKGDLNQFYQGVDMLIEQWKEEYSYYSQMT